MLSTPYRYLLSHAPSVSRVLNVRFFYCLCVNTLLYAISLWLLTGGGQYELLGSSSSVRILEILLSSTLLLFCIFYFLALLPFGIYGEWIMCALYFVIGVVDIFLSLTFHTQLNNVFFLIFLSTNTAEATEFLQFYATRLELICTLIGFIGLSAFFFALSLRPAPLPQDRIHRARSIQIAGIMLIVGSCGIGKKLHRLSQNETSIQLYLREKNALMRWYDAIESSIAERHAFIKEYHDLSKRLDENLAARHSPPTKEILANAQNLPLLVLVIGESTQRNYLSLYGYPLPTTPRLEALEQAGNLVLFRDFISSFPNTDRSLQRALTFSHYENALTPWWEQQNLIDILNLAEYKTHWISNQDMFSIYGNSPEILSRRARITRFSAMPDSQRSNIEPQMVSCSPSLIKYASILRIYNQRFQTLSEILKIPASRCFMRSILWALILPIASASPNLLHNFQFKICKNLD